MSLKNKNILVTGACGFIGSHLVEELVDHGAKVKAFVYYNSFNNWGWLDNIETHKKDSIEVISGDIRSIDSMKDAMQDVDIVFNLAALIAIPYSYISPSSYFKTNVEGTLNLLQLALDHDIEKVLQISTSEIYGTAKYIPIDENHPAQAQSPYSASKIGSDALATSFYNSFELPLTIIRPFNVYGPRQSARAVIPTIISQILSGKKEISLGAPNPTRDFTFVRDTVSGMRRICEANTNGKTINLGSSKEVSINDLAYLISDIFGKEVNFKFKDQQRMRPDSSEVDQLLCDNNLLIETTDWSPQIQLRDGLSQTIEWFKDNLHFYKSDIYNI
tara:strand:- start:1260 stop:2252 length:993 start_codon:yes stop_codon:yes gene_type:complete